MQCLFSKLRQDGIERIKDRFGQMRRRIVNVNRRNRKIPRKGQARLIGIRGTDGGEGKERKIFGIGYGDLGLKNGDKVLIVAHE